MKFRKLLLPLAAAHLAVPAVLPAQEPTCTCAPAPGVIGVVFEWGDDEGRAVVRALRSGGPADRAGIREGDVVVRIDGAPATRIGVDGVTRRMRAGDTVRVRMQRDGAEREVAMVAAPRVQVFGAAPTEVIHVRPGENASVVRLHIDSLATRIDSLQRTARIMVSRLDTARMREVEALAQQMQARMLLRESVTREAQALQGARLPEGVRVLEGARVGQGELLPSFLEVGARSVAGAELAELNEGLSRYFEVREGLLVLRVGPETPAARAGLQAGDVIVAVGGDAVTNQRQLRTAMAGAEQGRVRMEIVRQGRRSQVEVEWSPTTVYEFRARPGTRHEVIIQRNENRQETGENR